MPKFKIHTINNNKENLKIWRNISEGSLYSYLLINGFRIMVVMSDNYKIEKNKTGDILLWASIGILAFWLLLQITYWVKPSLFKNKKQIVKT